MRTALLRLALAFILLAPVTAGAAADDGCPAWLNLTGTGKRPGLGAHKVVVRMPEGTPAPKRAEVVGALAQVGIPVLLEVVPGFMPDSAILVRATDAQLDALAAKLVGTYQQPARAVREWFQYADNLDAIEAAGLILDTAVTRPEEIPAPPTWTVGSSPLKPVYWVVHFATPMSTSDGPDRLAPLMDQSGPLAKPAPIVLHEVDSTHLFALMTSAQAQRVRELPGIDWVGRWEAALKLGSNIVPSAVTCLKGRAGAEQLLRFAAERPKEQVDLTVELFDPSPELAKAVDAAGGTLTSQSEQVAYVRGPRALIRCLARRVEVKSIEVQAVARPDGLMLMPE